MDRHWRRLPLTWRVAVVVAGWLILISALHHGLNVERGHRKVVRLGYMPVISNLAAPLLDYASRNHGAVQLQALKFSSFAELGEALRNDQIEAAFMIAPPPSCSGSREKMSNWFISAIATKARWSPGRIYTPPR